MEVNSPHYVGSTWLSNGGNYNWDVGLLCSWNAGLSPAFGYWGNVGRGCWASRLGVAVVLKRKLQIMFRASRMGAAAMLKREFQTLYRASRVRRGLHALCLSTEVVLRHGLWFLRLGVAVVSRCGLWALRLGSARVALISLASEV